MRTTVALFACLFLAPAISHAQSGADAISLLERVTQHYRDAEGLHIEATVETNLHNEHSDSHSTSQLSMYTAPGGRFRYEGWDQSGSGLLVSDGTTEWHLSHSFGEYTKSPAGTYLHSRRVISGDDLSMVSSITLASSIINLDGYVRSAHYGKPESLRANHRKVRCTTIEFNITDTTEKRQAGQDFETTLWIDPIALVILQEVTTSQQKPYFGARIEPYGFTRYSVKRIHYTVTDINSEAPGGTFVFHPPAGTVEIAKLPSLVPDTAKSSVEKEAAQEAFRKKQAEDYVGKQLPPIAVLDAEGRTTSLARFKGHPLLIDVWATWCAPCLVDLPALQRIRSSTKNTDLAVVGIDEDIQPSDAINFLKRRGYDWPDLHYTQDLARQFGTQFIPLMILTDAEGKIVYFHNSADDEALTAAIAGLGEAYQTVSEH